MRLCTANIMDMAAGSYSCSPLRNEARGGDGARAPVKWVFQGPSSARRMSLGAPWPGSVVVARVGQEGLGVTGITPEMN